MIEKMISTTEARKKISAITDEVERDKVVFSFTKHGKVVAKLSPVGYVDQMEVDPNFTSDLKEFLSEYSEAMAVLAEK